ncbi:MAG: restriction endonuclease subunit S, partial [Campylobacteraceae bacterium]|nr:restriction endonuclease subunit S [Campylobacteraceae bacterium]
IHKQKTMIIQAPSDNKAIKKFLGYEWSNAKGAEGLHELGEPYTTPLYERENIENKNKIAYLIRQAFLNGEIEIGPELSDFAIYAPLHSCIDFKSANFNKAINLSLATAINPFENSKYTLEKLDTICEIKNGVNVTQSDDIAKYKVSRIETIADATFNSNAVKYTNDEVDESNFLQKGDILFSHINSVIHLGKTALFNIDEKIIHGINLLRFRILNNIVLPKFLLECMKLNDFIKFIQSNATKAIHQASVNTTFLKSIKIPLPPLDIQKQIVAECESVESENSRILNEIAEQKEQINRVLAKTGILNVEFQDNENLKDLPTPQDYNLTEWKSVKLDRLIEAKGGNTFPKEFQGNSNSSQNAFIKVSDMNLQENLKFINISNNYVSDEVVKNLKLTIFPINTIIFPKVGMAIHTNKKRMLKIPSIIDNNTMAIKSINIEKLNQQFLFLIFENIVNLKDIASNSNPPSINNSNLYNYQIPLPPLDAQEKIAQAINSIEQKISSLQTELNSLNGKQKEILEKYLF